MLKISSVAGTAEPVYGPEHIRSVHQHSKNAEAKQDYTELTSKDLAWHVATGTNVETQVFYIASEAGPFAMAQVIYSVVIPGVKTTAQFNIKLFDPKNPDDKTWSSTPLNNPSFHSSNTSFYADNVAVILSEDGGFYTIKSQADPDVFCNLTFTRLSPGFMAGKDGRTTYGKDHSQPWGEIWHKFWPRCKVEGMFVIKGKTVDVGGQGLFIHAMQNMKPHHAAARWNFANFQGPTTSAIMMEFTTPPSYGTTRVAVGGLAKDGQIISGTLDNTAEHVKAENDPEAQWPEPKDIKFTWKGKDKDGKEVVGVIEKSWGPRMDRVDVMGEVPDFVKKIASAAAGTRPYIYQYYEPATLKVTVGDQETSEEGIIFSEATIASSRPVRRFKHPSSTVYEAKPWEGGAYDTASFLPLLATHDRVEFGVEVWHLAIQSVANEHVLPVDPAFSAVQNVHVEVRRAAEDRGAEVLHAIRTDVLTAPTIIFSIPRRTGSARPNVRFRVSILRFSCVASQFFNLFSSGWLEFRSALVEGRPWRRLSWTECEEGAAHGMAKRPFNQANVGGHDRRQGAAPKRQKRDESQAAKVLAPESITSVRQLQGLFAEYSNVAKVQAGTITLPGRQDLKIDSNGVFPGVQTFKRFLAECRDLQYALHLNEEVKLCLLQEYLEAQTSRDGDETCNDLMQAWSFASQSNNFQLLSSVPTAIHLLLRTISLFPVWKKHGIALAKTVLQPSYLKIIYRSLGGSKDAISSPCLRLLTEINKFDNGSLCPYLHQSIDFTVKDLARNLEIKKSEKTDEPPAEDPDRPTVRTVFVRFILSFFQYGTYSIKADIMGLRAFTTPLFKHIRQDTAVAISEILETFKTHVLSDPDIARSAKTNYFNDWSLSRLAELCYREDPIESDHPDRTVADVTLEFLETICTTPGNGVCFKDNGWYTGAKLDGGADNKGSKLQVNNRILLGLLKSLRPYSNTYHLRLLIAVFSSSPELIAAYFGDSTAFAFDPKLTATWIGLSSVFLETIQIKVPEMFGYPNSDAPSAPPPVRNVIENIIPQQLTRAVLTKCLTFNNNFVRFISIRILNASFRKLADVLDIITTLSTDLIDATAWTNAAQDVLDEFSKRVPELSTVITAFNQTPQDGVLQREAASRLLLNYHELLPSSATASAASKFDFGPSLARVLARIDQSTRFEALEVAHCLHLAKLLPETRWWAKAASANYSPAITLMKIAVERGNDRTTSTDISRLLEKIVNDSPLFGKDERGDDSIKNVVHPLEALMESLECVRGNEGWDKILGYLDNACSRLVQSPYKFYDIVGEALERETAANQKRGLSPLLAALFHQFNFVKRGKEWNDAELKALSRWLLRISRNFWVIGDMGMVETREGDILTAVSDGNDSSEVFTQFAQGVRAWRDCLGEFEIGGADDLISFPMQFDAVSLTTAMDSKQLRVQHFETLKSAVETQRGCASLFSWRWLQLVVEVLLQVTWAADESAMNEAESKAWESLHEAVFSAYEEGAKRLLQNTVYESTARGKMCAVAMVDSLGTPLYKQFCRDPLRRLSNRFDEALIKVYAMLPLAPLSDSTGVKHAMTASITAAYKPLNESRQSQLRDRIDLFFTKLLDIVDSKYCCRNASVRARQVCGDQSFEFSSLMWESILSQLSQANETLAGEEVWGLIGAGAPPPLRKHRWSEFIVLAERLADAESLQRIQASATTVGRDLIDEKPVAFRKVVRCMFDAGMFTGGAEGLMDTAVRYLSSVPDRLQGEELTRDYMNLASAAAEVLKDVAMERDGNGRLRWRDADNDSQRAWKDSFSKVFYEQPMPGQPGVPVWQHFLSSPLVDDYVGVGYLEAGLDFGCIPCDETILAMMRERGAALELLSADTLPLFEAAYRNSYGQHSSWFNKRVKQTVYELTVSLSGTGDAEWIGERCGLLAGFLGRAGRALMKCVAKDAVDSLLEVVFDRLSVGGGVVALAAVILAKVPNVEHSKLLQSVLSSPTALSQRSTGEIPTLQKQEEQHRLAYIIRQLFNASKSQHSNVTTLDGVLSLYGGTNDATDAVLLDVLTTIEGRMSKSVMERITTLAFSDSEEKRLMERDAKGRIKVCISTKVLARSMANFFPSKVTLSAAGDDLPRFLEICARAAEDEERCRTYDVGFLTAVLTHGILSDAAEHRLDVKDVVEKQGLGYIIMGLASSGAQERGMAEAAITATVARLEGSSGEKTRGYKERVEVMHLLCKILAGIPALGENQLKDAGIPNVTALILARCVAVVANPSHFQYEMVMRWLQARAGVDLREVPLLRECLRSEGEGYWREVSWLVECLANGMRGSADVDLCRRRGVFEELISLYSTATARVGTAAVVKVGGSGSAREEAVRGRIVEMLWNAAGVEGGATTLITRTGVVSWIKMAVTAASADEEQRVRLKRLAARLWEGCDREYVKGWSGGNIGRVLESLITLGSERV
ncbi:hypothetical protein Dda_6222 [Drechslerella dactyloides]|uniref:Uncharacterized protein n=1 Tax=Drechslerella dactyloides TaxID=74499 RepID=A0AAD6IVX5_DREDA|nr:hypothetical protein Dda_6222 [Drechslerella dactyloides]